MPRDHTFERRVTTSAEREAHKAFSSLLKNLGNLSFFVSVARLIRCQVLCSLA